MVTANMSQTHDRSRTYLKHRRLTAAIEDVPHQELDLVAKAVVNCERGRSESVLKVYT